MPHNFKDSLAKSAATVDQPYWSEIYRAAFPDLQAFASIRDDGWAQRGGIDRVLTLNSGKTLQIDEKVRFEEYDDILLEYWSDIDRRARGWVAKDLACDYLAYAFHDSGRCYLLPFQELRRCWRLRCKDWVSRHKRIEAHNEGYITVSVAVPIDELMAAITDSLFISFTPEVPA